MADHQLCTAAQLTEDLRWRENVQRAAVEWCVDVEQIKPCVAQIREIEKGKRDLACYILCTELRRVGLTPDQALSVVSRWNDANLPPLTSADASAKLKSAYAKEKVYGCNGPLSEWCVGKDECPYVARFIRGNQPVPGRTTAVDFERLGWTSPHVTPGERVLYAAVERLERMRDVGPGGLLITSTRRLAEIAGLSPSGVLNMLHFFHAMGLVEYTAGRPRATGLPPKGCCIRRTIPIPHPQTRNPGWGREVRGRLRERPATDGDLR